MLAVSVFAVGCASRFVPPAPPAPHEAAAVGASFGRTWDATVDFFASEHVPITTLDKTSGFIVTDRQTIRHDLTHFADCGKYSDPMTTGRALVPLQPSNVSWNIVVRGDSVASTVRAAARFTGVYVSSSMGTATTTEPVECSSKGAWETEIERRIKARAEARQP